MVETPVAVISYVALGRPGVGKGTDGHGCPNVIGVRLIPNVITVFQGLYITYKVGTGNEFQVATNVLSCVMTFAPL